MKVRIATLEEQAEYYHNLAELNDPSNFKNYVLVALENSDQWWYLDDSGLLEVGAFVKVGYNQRIVCGEIIAVRNCSIFDPPCAGKISAVLQAD